MIRRVLVTFALLVSIPALLVSSPAAAAEVRNITLPIAPEGASQVSWIDSYGAPRSGGRSHKGVDMMGPKMTPLVAAADGTISWLRHSDSRGNNLNITDADGWTYYYIHINNDTPGTDDGANDYEFAFAPGIENGSTVRAGQVVAYMGDSGNAEWTGSHLHFEITRPDGSNINPTPSVDAALANLVSGTNDLEGLDMTLVDEALASLGDSLMGTELSKSERNAIMADMALNGLGPTLEEWVGVDSRAASIDRLYKAFFLRLPDAGGYNYWIETYAAGNHLNDLAEVFAASDEYQIRYPEMTFSEFLDQLYLEVLDRTPDEDGKAYWLDELDKGHITRGAIVVQFTESPELKNLTGLRSEAIAITTLLQDRMPTDQEIADWQAMRSSVALADALENLFTLNV